MRASAEQRYNNWLDKVRSPVLEPPRQLLVKKFTTFARNAAAQERNKSSRKARQIYALAGVVVN